VYVFLFPKNHHVIKIDHEIIDKIISESGIFKKKPSLKRDHAMLRVIVYEAMFGEKADCVDELWTRFDKIN